MPTKDFNPPTVSEFRPSANRHDFAYREAAKQSICNVLPDQEITETKEYVGKQYSPFILIFSEMLSKQAVTKW